MGMMMMTILESPRLLTEISCFHVKHDEGGMSIGLNNHVVRLLSTQSHLVLF